MDGDVVIFGIFGIYPVVVVAFVKQATGQVAVAVVFTYIVGIIGFNAYFNSSYFKLQLEKIFKAYVNKQEGIAIAGFFVLILNFACAKLYEQFGIVEFKESLYIYRTVFVRIDSFSVAQLK